MDTDRWKQIEEILAEALDLDPEEWEPLLERRCGDDHSLAGEVREYLAVDRNIGDFLRWPGSSTPLPRSIGPYRPVRLVGSGGMGDVYLAYREGPDFRQRVALKLIRRESNRDEIRRRFAAERHALAHLEHPHIARLLDAGVAEGNLPYLAMEFVDGQRLDHYCDERALPVGGRLRLFLQVCSAVRYAHSKLIIHRDIKPSNILVTEDNETKLLDFGIVKILDPGDPFSSDLTQVDHRIFTPDFASPEQIRGEPVSTATDIYALGVVLYELLTGHRPHRIKTGSMEELHHLACETTPLTPSESVTREETITTRSGSRTVKPAEVGRQRGVNPEKLRRQLVGDLDNIVMLALRKDPEERYPSVEKLGEDIENHLKGLPISARRPTLMYRAQKFVRRHWAGLAAGMLILVVTLGVGGLVLGQRRQARERDREAAERFLIELSAQRHRFEVTSLLETEAAKTLSLALADQPRDFIRFSREITSICRAANLHEFEARWRLAFVETLKSSAGESTVEEVHQRLLLARAYRRSRDEAAADAQLTQAERVSRRLPARPDLSARIWRERALLTASRGDYELAKDWFRKSLAVWPVDSP